MEDALEMCRMLVAEGADAAYALAHQNEHYPKVTVETIQHGTNELRKALKEAGIGLSVFAGSEVMVHPTFIADTKNNLFQVAGSNKRYMLIEFPHGIYIDLRESVYMLMQMGIRPILAHPEQHPELLHSEMMAEELVRLGCLFQISTGNITNPRSPKDEKAIKRWMKQGLYHVIGSDGHGPNRRPPLLRAGYLKMVNWIGQQNADRIAATNAMFIFQGLPVIAPKPPFKKSFFSRLLKKFEL